MTHEEKMIRQHLAGIDHILGEFEREDSLEGRIHVMGLAMVCLLNSERDRVLQALTIVRKPGIIIDGAAL